ncbi:MAG: ammonium transporter [Myxococcota bacterium]
MLSILLFSAVAAASEDSFSVSDAMFWINNTWMLVAAFMVFIMHLGFAALESGLAQAKNTVNILFKNLLILSIGLLTYGFIGFNLMYPGESFAGGLFGFGGFGLNAGPDGLTAAYADGAYTYWTDFIFQGMFAATAATIVSGAVAERVRLSSFLLFAAVYVAIIYPIVGFWQWGGGWLKALGFYDFAGSTIVHGVGGWAALVGAWMLGPRLGRFDGHIKSHSLPLAAIGVLLLWFGWYGFNGGSVLSADPAAVSLVVVTTSMSAATGALTSAMISWGVEKKPDLSMALNGALAGLVGVTAGADVLSPMSAVVVGLISGVLVIAACYLFERLRIDDPVSAAPVHLVCGIWGTLAVGLFVEDVSIISQIIGVSAVAAFCLPTSFLLFVALDKTLGLRVSEQEERTGLDIEEHGQEAYNMPTPSLLDLTAK